jgi:hypothetical protein
MVYKGRDWVRLKYSSHRLVRLLTLYFCFLILLTFDHNMKFIDLGIKDSLWRLNLGLQNLSVVPHAFDGQVLAVGDGSGSHG